MKSQMTIERCQAYTEISEILKILGNRYSKKVPNKVKEYFENNSSKDYKFKINSNVNVFEQIKNPITINLLGMLKYNYWCNNEEEKKQLLNKFSNNDKEREKELREKYNPDNIFKKYIQETSVEENIIKDEVDILEYKESIFKRIINKIKSIFNR